MPPFYTQLNKHGGKMELTGEQEEFNDEVKKELANSWNMDIIDIDWGYVKKITK